MYVLARADVGQGAADREPVLVDVLLRMNCAYREFMAAGHRVQQRDRRITDRHCLAGCQVTQCNGDVVVGCDSMRMAIHGWCGHRTLWIALTGILRESYAGLSPVSSGV